MNFLIFIAPDSFEQQNRSRSGCFLFSTLGCLATACVGLVVCACLVPFASVIGLGAFVGAVLNNPASTTGSQTFRVENMETARLEINDEHTEVSLHVGPTEEIIVNYEVTAYGWNESSAKDNLNEIQVNMTPLSDGTIRISVEQGDSVLNVLKDIKLDITVPFMMQDVVINTSRDVTISDLEAHFLINTQGGNITLTDVIGSFDLETTSGSITLNGLFREKTNSTITSDWGDISITIQGGSNVSYTTRSSTGDVRCPNTAIGKSCTGTVGVGSANLTVDNNSGDVTILTTR